MIQCSGDPNEACKYTDWGSKPPPNGWTSNGTDTSGHLSALYENKTDPKEPGLPAIC